MDSVKSYTVAARKEGSGNERTFERKAGRVARSCYSPGMAPSRFFNRGPCSRVGSNNTELNEQTNKQKTRHSSVRNKMYAEVNSKECAGISHRAGFVPLAVATSGGALLLSYHSRSRLGFSAFNARTTLSNVSLRVYTLSLTSHTLLLTSVYKPVIPVLYSCLTAGKTRSPTLCEATARGGDI